MSLMIVITYLVLVSRFDVFDQTSYPFITPDVKQAGSGEHLHNLHSLLATGQQCPCPWPTRLQEELQLPNERSHDVLIRPSSCHDVFFFLIAEKDMANGVKPIYKGEWKSGELRVDREHMKTVFQLGINSLCHTAELVG